MKPIEFNRLIKSIKAQANSGTWGGTEWTEYFDKCGWMQTQPTVTIRFTRDTGAHSSGWWKNPDFERCYHLSIAFHEGSNNKLLNKYLKAIFGEFRKYLWIEPPYSEGGKSLDIWHYRLFCDENWQPIKPRKEVYSTEFTPPGYKTWSELQAELKAGNK